MIVSVYTILLALIVFFELNGFYLLDGQIPATDIAIVLELIFAYFVYRRSYGKFKYKYGTFFAFTVVLAVTSAIMAKINYEQPLLIGFRPQRAWLGAMLSYFPLTYLIKTGRYNVEKILDVIDGCNFIFFVLIFAQYIVGDKVTILSAMTNERYGSIRIYVQTIFLMISFMRYFCKLIKGERISIKVFFYIIAPIFTVFFITKSRMEMVAFSLTVVIVLMRQRLTARKLFITTGLIIIATFFLSSTVGQDVIAMITGTGAMQDSSGIREIGREFYLLKLRASATNTIFGCGYPSILWEKAAVGAGFRQYININDNGIFGQVFIYGLLYLIWFVALHCKLIRDAVANKNDFVLGFVLIGLLGTYSLVPYCSMNYIAFSLACAICESSDELEDIEAEI